jgi:hypothetical protein
MSAATKQAISGAAQGAAYGSIIPGVGTAIGAVAGGIIGGIGGWISGGSADRQFKNQQDWARYNNAMAYNTNIYNAYSEYNLAAVNAAMMQGMAGVQVAAIQQNALYNAAMQAQTTQYNNELIEQELYRVWDEEELELAQLEDVRERERGAMEADQSVSGTVMNQDSNEDVIVDQMTQQALDETIVRHNADRRAADVLNSLAQNTWQGQVAIQHIMYEGEMQAYTTSANAALQSTGTMIGAGIRKNAQIYNAEQARYTGNLNINQAKTTFNEQQTQQMVSGLFNAATTATVGAFANKVPTSSGSGGGLTHMKKILSYGSNSAPRVVAPRTLATAGTSLLGPDV